MKTTLFFFLIIIAMVFVPSISFSTHINIGGVIIDDEVVETESPQFALDCSPYTHKFSQETQHCEIWWNSAYVAFPTIIFIIFIIISIIIISWKYKN